VAFLLYDAITIKKFYQFAFENDSINTTKILRINAKTLEISVFE